MKNEERLILSLQQVRELAAFAHTLFEKLERSNISPGENLLPHVSKLKLTVPDFIADFPITWETHSESEFEKGMSDSLVLLMPGQPQVLGFTIGCIRFGSIRVCLECGWLWCRIVIKGRF